MTYFTTQDKRLKHRNTKNFNLIQIGEESKIKTQDEVADQFEDKIEDDNDDKVYDQGRKID